MRLTYCLFILLVGSSSAFAQEAGIQFQPKLLTIDANEGIDVADIDGDGNVDIVAGRNWYQAPDFAPRPLRLIEDWNGYVESNGDFCHDVDKDGLIDVIAGSFLPSQVHWFKNPGSEALMKGELWKKELLIDTGIGQNEASYLHDINGDGSPEWISNSWNKENPTVIWEFATGERDVSRTSGQGNNPERIVPAVTAPTLVKHVIGDANGHGMGFGDVNNDGREDILFANGWYERPEGDLYAKKWQLHSDWSNLNASCPILVRDLDGDGKNDVIWGKGHDYGLFWWQSEGPDESGRMKFKQHVIDDRYSQPHTIHFADLDGDGIDELISGKRVRAHNGSDPGGSEMACMYYYQWNGDSKSFLRFVIEEGHVGTGLQIRTADLNADGKLDIAVAGKDGTWLLFNQGKQKRRR